MTEHDPAKELRYWQERALNLLMRREHSIVELTQKLTIKGCPETVLPKVLAYCHEHNYVSLERFAEMFARNQANLGYGPHRVTMQLRQHQVPSDLINIALEEADFTAAKAIALRKIGAKPEPKLKAALYRRGF
ncbi:regulatory protein RecX [Wohlfahrtiimonas chitiniclastica]|uniref:regulatory protein RecX n=1 Tax=Wohlfahrtiimonas chitiniclastica TaxID=400946 RepID=UPI001BD0257E|nr:regulatory protein RecX [Wohlfahrtiimonas chitiniclastica]MBS7819677.1 regulatory protein RecX [Wohlfahrtiimonas chitiniclastica]MBS7835296.1 regulatory protein RecX [Wohlfahrtiimonas chitiniclastica]